MTETQDKQKQQTLGFQTEVKQLLHLVIHALYSNKEIFLRELISNASDANDKLRFEALDNAKLLKDDSELSIKIDADKENNTLTITDNGIGLSEQEAIDNLGTIAKSGTQEFLNSLTGDKSKDANLIGQFGVGFYSAFIVADKVTVRSLRAGAKPEEAIEWSSDGHGEFTLTSIEKEQRGTEITLHLKEEALEFLETFRLQSIIAKYSDHIRFPVLMKQPEPTGEEAEGETPKETYQAINKATALWTRNKSDVSNEEYQEFYKHVSHDFNDALFWVHNRVEGKLEYTSLLFVPEKPPFDLWHRDGKHGLKLYIQRVFIMDEVDKFLPLYLRFVKGVIDSNDLPLNISREILQEDKTVDTIKAALTKRILDKLSKLAEKNQETYQKFWNNFGQVLKEGPTEDFANKDKIAKLLRFSTTESASAEQSVSLDDYISRMKEGQDKIYYVAADTYEAAKNSPHLEVFAKKGIEVLLLSDRVDEWLIGSLMQYEEKQFQSVVKGNLELDDIKAEGDAEKAEDNQEQNEAFKDTLARATEVLKDEVKEVRLTDRLTVSPACVVVDDNALSPQMERILKSAGQEVPTSKPILELNPEHHIVKKLQTISDDNEFNTWVKILLDQAILAEGGQLSDPAGFVKKLNEVFNTMDS